MLIKDAMTRTSIKFYESDAVLSVSQQILKENLQGGLVYNVKDELVGSFTKTDLLNGLINEEKKMSQIVNDHYYYLNESDDIAKKICFKQNKVLPVVNRESIVVGFLTKEQYLEAYSRFMQVELYQKDAIFDSAHNGILSIDQNGIITSINPAAEKMALTTKEKAIGSFLTDIVTNGGLLHVVRTGKGHSEKYKVGKRVYLSHRTPIYDGSQLVGAVGVFQDISEIEFMADELESVKQVLNEQETIFQNTSDGICITDNSGDIIKCNQKFKEIFIEKDEKQAIGVPDIITEIVSQVTTSGKQQSLMKKSGVNENSLIISATPIRNSEKTIERIVINIRDITELDCLRMELEKAKTILENIHLTDNNGPFIAKSKEMKRVIEIVGQVAEVDVTVLLTGESGVGKEKVANLIQQSSTRADKPYIRVNCGAIPENLMESELFGYVGGAFTGALKNGKAGLFEQADKGTLFLDEIGEIPLQLQVKLLRVLQEMEVTRVGASSPKKIDVRIIAATNQDLQDLVVDGKFREDLFYRLNVIPISIPPLRKRIDDIPLLIDRYSKIFAEKYKKNLHFKREAIDVLMKYRWPGNVRELVNILERIYVTSTDNSVNDQDVFYVLGDKKSDKGTTKKKAVIVNEVIPFRMAVNELERELIDKATQVAGSYRGAAKLLEVNPSTIVRKVKKLEEGEI